MGLSRDYWISLASVRNHWDWAPRGMLRMTGRLFSRTVDHRESSHSGDVSEGVRPTKSSAGAVIRRLHFKQGRDLALTVRHCRHAQRSISANQCWREDQLSMFGR